ISGATATHNVVEGNFIGMKPDGNTAYPIANVQQGIVVDHAVNTMIGGTTTAARNVMAGVQGLTLTSASGTTLQGNYFGMDRTGTTPVCSTDAISMTGSSDTLIGGTTAGAGNLIGSGSQVGTVAINNDLAKNLTIQGNFIGVTPAGQQISHYFIGINTQR